MSSLLVCWSVISTVLVLREWTWRYAMLDVLPVPVLPSSTFAIHYREEATSHHHQVNKKH
jgi:hypothetical protein